MADSLSESTFWWVISGASAFVVAMAGGVVAWAKGSDATATREFDEKHDDLKKVVAQAIIDSKRDRENLWDELRERTDQYNRDLANVIDRINVVKDTYVRRDDMAEKFQALSTKLDEQAALIELVRGRIHDLATLIASRSPMVPRLEEK